MLGFGFVEFENARVCISHIYHCFVTRPCNQDAEDALRDFNGKNFMGQKLALSLLSWFSPQRILYAVSLLNLPRNLGRVVSRTKTGMGIFHRYRGRFDHILTLK